MKFLLPLLFTALIFAGCTYSKKEVDYPLTGNACDTTGMTFASTIKPILDASCNNCHGGSGSLGGGYIFDTYAGVKDELNNAGDEFLNSIKHIGSVTPMPKDGTKLADCEISKIAAWINAGAPQ